MFSCFLALDEEEEETIEYEEEVIEFLVNVETEFIVKE